MRTLRQFLKYGALSFNEAREILGVSGCAMPAPLFVQKRHPRTREARVHMNDVGAIARWLRHKGVPGRAEQLEREHALLLLEKM
jgi:hypothetical protein